MRGRILALFAAFVCTAFSLAHAQETRGSIVGRILDQTGSVIPAADVVVINDAMGTRTALKSNANGLYQAALLIPGTYTVEVDAPGFKKFVRSGIELQINDRLEINARLELGTAEQSITVVESTPLVDRESASMGQVIDSKRVADLPLSYGNPFELIGLAAGVSFARDPRLDRPFEPTHIVGYAIDGTRANRSDVTLDGAPSTATANANEVTATYVPPTDIIAEFKVQTATFDASFGQTEGGVTNISIKSGTNAYHGTAYYSMTRPSLWANDFFANATGKPRADFVFNRWGGSIGGPVILPKLYDGKNKTFFLWGYEGINDSRPRNDGTPTVPTAKMKTGDFSDLLALGPQYQIYNPFTRRAVGSRFQADPFVGNIIPPSFINPVGKKLLSYYADPTSPGNPDGTQNFQQPGLTEQADYFTHTVRVDQNLGDRQRIYVRGSMYNRNSTYDNYFNNLATGTWFQFYSRSGVVDHVYTLNPTTVVNVRYGYNRFIRAQTGNPEAIGLDLTTLGFPQAYDAAIPKNIQRFPRIDLAGYQGTGITGEYRPVDTHSLNGNITKSLGAHSIRGGMEFRAYRETDAFTSNDQTGRFNFDTTWTRGPLDNSTAAPQSLGQSVAALLLGLPTSSNSFVQRPADYAEQSTSWGFFAQDDWKATRKLTLNFGLRWEFEGALRERYNRSVKGFDYSYVPPYAAQAIANYAKNPTSEVPADRFRIAGGLTFAGVGGNSSALYNTPKDNLMPRFGFAYEVAQGTIIRGGYGIFYGFLGERRGDVIQSGFSRQTPFIPTQDNINFIATLSNPFPNGILEPVGASQGPLTFNGQAITFFNPDPKQSKMQRWQFGIQHEFRGNFLLEAAYVGNKGTRIEITRNINTTPQQYLSTSALRDQAVIDRLSGNVPNPFLGLLPAGAISALTGNNISRERLLRPFPQFDTINTTTYDGYSWYHDLQLRMEKRFSKGYTVTANYTYSKFMQATELLNPSDASPTRVISDQDYPHRLAVSGIYEMPFGHGRQFLGSTNRVVDALVGGWQVTGIWMYQSGAPINWNATVGGAANAISFRGNINDIKLSSDQQSTAAWFNTKAGFVTNSTEQIDTARQLRTFPLRFGFLRTDNTNNFDFALIKNTRIRESQAIQFRAEALNALNHPLLPAPNTNPTAAAFGQVSGSTQANYPRRLQLTLKYLF